MIDTDKAWSAVLRRDRSFDGRFVTGVLTTGIYCRPSCAARHPARGNVRFFAGGAEARAAGLRPCKRCLPDDVARDEAAVLAAIDEIKSSEGMPQLAELADAVGYSPHGPDSGPDRRRRRSGDPLGGRPDDARADAGRGD